MKVLVAAHGYPPALAGGTELWAQAVARGLTERGHEVAVVAGDLASPSEFQVALADDGGIPVRRLQRADLYFDHWHKSQSPAVTAAFAAELERFQPDVVHLMHWLRLSDDLVRTAASHGVPSVVSLQDAHTACLLTFRLEPDSASFCTASFAAGNCVSCAQKVPPRTPWVPLEQQFMRFMQRQQSFAAELAAASVRTVPSRFLGELLCEHGVLADMSQVDVLAPALPSDWTAATPRAFPSEDGRIVLGCWGHQNRVKGLDLVLDAVALLEDPRRVEIHVAGRIDPAFQQTLDEKARGIFVTFHGPYERDALPAHPVTNVHAMVSGTRAAESWGFVADEGLQLGLPLVLPRAGAFAERFREGSGVVFFEPGDSHDLARCLSRLRYEDGLLENLRATWPEARLGLPKRADHLQSLEALYATAVERGAPKQAERDWFEARMRAQELVAWDEGCSRTSGAELGFGEGAQ